MYVPPEPPEAAVFARDGQLISQAPGGEPAFESSLSRSASLAGPGQPPAKKAGDFPARKPGEPSLTTVTRSIELHLPYPWQIT